MKLINDKISVLFRDLYPNLGTIQSIECIHNQINSEIHKICTKNHIFLLHRNMHDNELRIEKMCKILHQISKSKKNTIKPIRNKFGNFSQNRFYLTKFEFGDFFSGNKKEYFDLAKKLNILHKELQNYNIKYNFRPNQQSYKFLTTKELMTIKNKLSKIKNKKLIDNIINNNILFIENQITNCKIFSKNKFFEKQLIHFDLHPNNVLFVNNSVKLFLDFNSMRKGNIMEDILFSGFRFAYCIDSNPKIIYNLLDEFLKKYFNNHIDYSDEILNYHLSTCILYRICFILKNHFFSNSDLWLSDFNNQLKYLKLANKIFS